MDSLTQAVLGAAVGEAVLGRKLGNRAIGWGLLFGTLPDLDVIVSPFLSHSWNLWWHRGPSHSLLVMILASWGLSKPLAKWWKRDKVSRSRAGWFVFAVWSTHVLIDCFTVYGTSVWWPFPQRVALNNLFIIDPLFTAPMLVALVWLAFLRTKKQLPKRRRLNAWGLGISTAYVALSFGMKALASSAFEADLKRRGVEVTRRFEAPTPFNIVFWRSVADRGDALWVGYHSVFEGRDAPVRWTVYPKNEAALAGLEDLRATRTVKWFSNGWWIARKHVKGAWIADMRFGELRTWGARKGSVDSRFMFAWDILPDAHNDPLQPIRAKRSGMGETLERLSARMFGIRGKWEGNPRLEGVTGSLPETLGFVD
ncbi:MAG: metal-dependent hydrolase [Akkermansiaceae bacterium]|nr:metal-dependent hydrolase [Akkermansiaceae bacterium]